MLSSEDIATISTTVCRDMLGLDFDVDVDFNERSVLSILAAIRISGDYQAIIEVATTPSAANVVTAAMCGLPMNEICDADLADSLGEIANIIGGNIKGAIPGETILSLPCVDLKHANRELAASASAETNSWFRLAQEPFCVRLKPIT